MSTKKKN